MEEFEMSQEQLDVLMDSTKAVPMIAINCGTTMSQQERANRAWQSLSLELGFEHMTARPARGKSNRFFEAIRSKP
jgi:hypothetical protein